MRTLNIQGSAGISKLMVGEGLKNLRQYVPDTKVVIITDHNVRNIYGKDLPPWDIIEIGTGEKIKNLDTVKDIYAKLIELGADRATFITGIGGGVVCDITGFAASTYMRGVRFGFVSSTLLSQVDASVGGKNGVDFHGYKNIVGVFNQPEFVICDMKMLKTLPENEILCGMAEIVKHGAVADAGLFSYLEENYREALSLDKDVIERLVYDSIYIKSGIVNRDEKEQGERKKLNFGHTFGHAIEKVTGAPHGEAVSVGMVVASRISVNRGYLSTHNAKRIKGLIKKMGLPVELGFNRADVLDALEKDKKKIGDRIEFVLLGDIGKAAVEEIEMQELKDCL